MRAEEELFNMLDDCSRVVDKMNRKKTLEEDLLKTPLNRCLTTFDLTLFGISQMVGAGIFVLTGTVIRDKAGPGGILSYLFAGVAAVLSALCYAEFGARVPKAGSAYTYTYIIIGEFWAFLVGWNIILEYLIGASAVARGLSGSFDALSNYKISNWTSKHIGTMPGEWLSDYPDFVSFFLVILVSCLVACTGAKKSVVVNSVFTIVNVVVIVFVAVLGFCYADPTVWEEGGFLPYGMGGVFGGAAACFYAFIGFDAISIAGEEAATPGRSIPIATMLSVVVCTVLYVFATMALTLLVPYDELSASAPFPVAFDIRGLKWAKIVVSIGTIIAMFTALLVDLFALPRTVYAISSDGLFFEAFSRINERTQTPVLSIMAFGFLAALLALFFSIDTLVEFLSIGTLLAYTIVAAAVIFIRYQPLSKCQFALKPDPTDDNLKEVETPEGARLV
ncbi:cationic amino acid transporter 4-like [Lingula anatina]|uniref:Cationic amino acid transporter 4-like n=1 Tax=Lingula anatina TaxID=7574 RepID=A0A1S3IID3_LINAN|nr:cationic amino acid transporter 4-like [Lingula anatina]|eukprot:XP_013397641.1 cationic amino acid transporter 4-like [Lingula anatina]